MTGPVALATGHASTRRASAPERNLALTLYRLATGIAVLGWSVSLITAIDGPDFYEPGVFAVSAAALGVGVAWSLLDCRASAMRRVGLKVFVITALVVMTLQPFVVVSSQPPLYPQLVHVLGVAACLSPLVFGTRAGVAVAVGWGSVFGLLRQPETGPIGAVVEGAVVAVTVLVCVAALHLVRKASAAVSAAAAAERVAAEAAARSALRLRERERWDLVLHDLILGALILASRVGERNRAAAAQLAAQALRALDAETTVETETLSTLLATQGRRLGLELRVDLQGDVYSSAWPWTAWEAVAGAVTEALVNIARHSGEREADVRAVIQAHAAEITITDTGRGFDPDMVEPSRAGVRRGIVRRMRAVGGEATIIARPGIGVTVSITWADDRPQAVAPADWDLRIFAPLAVLGVSLLGLHVVMGRGQLPLAANALVAAALLILTAVIWWLPRSSRWWPAAAVALIGLPATVVTELGLGLPVDLKFWFAGATGPAVAGLSFKYRSWSGAAVVVGSLLVASAAASAGSDVPWGAMTVALLPAYADPLAGAVGGALLSTALDSFSASINRDNRQLVELQIEADRREIRLAEIDRRQRSLREAVIPMLRRIVDGTELTGEERTSCQVMEQTARDQLVAPTLVESATVASAVLVARTRGVTVILSSDESASETGVDTFQALLLAVVEGAPAGAVVRARWRPRGDDLGTVVVVGAQPGTAETTRWQDIGQRGGRTRVELSRDEDSILLELVVG